MKTATQAAANYGTNGGSPTAANLWAANFSANIPAILTAAQKAVALWQSQVSTALAAANFVNGLAKAQNNIPAITTKVNGTGKASFSAGVKAAAVGNYQTFAGPWMAAVGAEVTTLNTTNPRGDRTANRSRQAAYDAWVDSQAGKFRVK